MITIVDYGMGNLRSVQKGFERVGVEARITDRAEVVARAKKLVLPGVGACGDAMRGLESRGLIEPIRAHVQSGRPFLGICLGLQLLFTKSYEGGEFAGFDILPGAVVRFPAPDQLAPNTQAMSGRNPRERAADLEQSPAVLQPSSVSTSAEVPEIARPRLKVPHMGWNQLHILRRAPMLSGIPNGAYVYFVHSYYGVPRDPSVIATETEYGFPFTSSVWCDSLFATQFHPEKSQQVGLQLLRNFATL